MAIITDASQIAVLAADNAWENYTGAVFRAGTATCPKMRMLLDSVARASLEQFCRKVDQHPSMLPYHLAQSGHWLDKRFS